MNYPERLDGREMDSFVRECLLGGCQIWQEGSLLLIEETPREEENPHTLAEIAASYVWEKEAWSLKVPGYARVPLELMRTYMRERKE